MKESALQLDPSSTRMVSLHHYAEEFDTLYQPLYLEPQNRGFHDLQRLSVSRTQSLLENNVPSDVESWDVTQDGEWLFRFRMLWLRCTLSASNPDFLLSEVICTSSSISTERVNFVRKEIADYIKDGLADVDTFMDLALLILRAAELTSYFCSTLTNQTLFVSAVKWSNEQKKTLEMLKWNRVGLNPHTVKDTSYEYLGMTPFDICKTIPENFRILEMRSIRTDELTQNFLVFQKKFSHKFKYESTDQLRRKMHPVHNFQRRNLATVGRDEIVRDMIRPHVTFHGTIQSSVTSIAQNGFKKPGEIVDGTAIASPRSGAIFRRGIYSSQSSSYAMSFAACHNHRPVPIDELPGMRLLVCATLTGRTLCPDPKDEESYLKIHGTRVSGYDAHFDGGYEYIVHHSDAILPCYVIWLDFGIDAFQEIRKTQQRWSKYDQIRPMRGARRCTSTSLTAKEKREIAQEVKAAIFKYLPLGFGSADMSGMRDPGMVERDDDEETCGVAVYHELTKKLEWESEQKFNFWNNILAGRGPRFTHEPENAIPMNLEKLLYLDDDVCDILGTS